MKILIIVITCLLIIQTTLPSVAAVSPTPTKAASEPSETVSEKFTEQINNLKEKIASRVAELKLVEKRGVIGTVTDVSGTQITLLDLNKEVRIIDVDELTKFSSQETSDDEFGISDIAKGDSISIIGLYNKDSRRLLARFIETVTLPVFASGIASDIDEDEFTVTILTPENTKYIIDIEKTTKTSLHTKEEGLIKSGFSDVELGQRIYSVGYMSKTEKNRISATRIILLPELQSNPAIKITINPTPTDPPITLAPTKRSVR